MYGAIVSPPPKELITVSKVLLKPDDGSSWEESKTVKDEIIIPEGYGIDTIYYSVGARKMFGWANFIVTVAGKMRINNESEFSNWWFADAYAFNDLSLIEGVIPISAQFTCHRGGMVSIAIKLRRKYDLLKEWQLDTFNAIVSSYESKVQDCKDALAELRARQGIDFGDNPAFYREIENTVLKKNCLSYLTGHGYLGKDFIVGEEIGTNQVNRNEEMDKYTSAVKFFEQAFEWDLMQYTFYPFYWANKDNWEDLYGAENSDGLFRAFLRSGMARTVVTVRPGFEEAVMYYMATGLIWNGGEVPIIGDDLYLSVVDELNNPEYVLEETWETRVPSSLTLIQAKTIALEADGLPCYCDTGNPPTENIKEPTVNPLTGLDVFIEGDTA